MSQSNGLSRRTFLKNAALTAVAGAVGTGTSVATAVPGITSVPPDTKYDFDEVYDRVGTDSVKWDGQIAKYGKENIAVGMGIADMDFRCAPAITRALQKRIQHENWGYLEMPPAYIESIVDWNKRRYGIDINPDSLMHSDGVHPGLLSALKAFSPPGSRVLVLAPTYNAFYTDIHIVGCKEEESPLKHINGRYHMDFEDLERRIDHDTNTLILCNPQNPTGNVWSREDLMTLGEICTRRRVVVLSDEIHCDFMTKGNKYTPFCTLDNEEVVRNSITFKSVSKSFSLAAMRCAYLFSTNPDYLERVKATGHRQSISTLGVVAAQAAYNESEDWLDQVVEYIDGTFDYVESFIGSNIPLIKLVKPQGTYLAWPDVSAVVDKIGAKEKADQENKMRDPSARPVTPSMIVERYFVENAKVQMNAGSDYGYGGEGRMRMNLGTSRKLVELALKNMAGALAKA